MRKPMHIFLIVLILSAPAGFIAFQGMGRSVKSKLNHSDIRVKTMPDGRYHGAYQAWGWIPAAEVVFSIQDSVLIDFELLEVLTTPGYGAKAKIQKRIERSKNFFFDGVTGSTISSNFTKAAIMNAVNDSPVQE